MSKTQQIRVEAASAASPAALYALLVDGPSWVAWSPIDQCVPEGLGPDGREQVGTVRMNRRGRTRGWDRTTELIPNRSLGYAHLKGLPVRDYVAKVTLEPTESDGTAIVWTASFRPRWAGTGALYRRGIESFLRDCAAGLATAVSSSPARAESVGDR
jgi:hypothetical protein